VLPKLKNIRYLSLEVRSQRDVEVVQQCESLEALDVLASDVEVSGLATLKQLKAVRVRGDARGVEKVATIAGLRSLDLRGYHWRSGFMEREDALGVIGTCPTLEFLGLDESTGSRGFIVSLRLPGCTVQTGAVDTTWLRMLPEVASWCKW
jgi:hypothetical protein